LVKQLLATVKRADRWVVGSDTTQGSFARAHVPRQASSAIHEPQRESAAAKQAKAIDRLRQIAQPASQQSRLKSARASRSRSTKTISVSPSCQHQSSSSCERTVSSETQSGPGVGSYASELKSGTPSR